LELLRVFTDPRLPVEVLSMFAGTGGRPLFSPSNDVFSMGDAVSRHNSLKMGSLEVKFLNREKESSEKVDTEK
jgi:hypothetical protein